MLANKTESISAIERGTIIHKLMEFNLKEEIGVYRNSSEEANEANTEYYRIKDKITDEMIEVADLATKQVLKIYEWYKKQNQSTYMVSEGYVHWVGGGKGIPDVYIVSGKYVHVIELKTGSNYNIHNPWDEIYIGYSSGIMRQTEQKIGEVRVTVISGFDYKTGDEPYTGEDIEYWTREQQRRLDLKALKEKEENSLELAIERMTQDVMRMIEENPEAINSRILDAMDNISKLTGKVFNKAKEQVIDEGVEYEGYGLTRKKKSTVDEDKLIDYLVEKEGWDRKLFKAFKPHKGNIEANFDAETVDWVINNEIFRSEEAPGYNFGKKK